MQDIVIYTDGACSGNPGPGGYAAIIMYGENKKEIYGGMKDTTNNRMELMAAIEGLKVLTKPCNVKLYSDSAYLVNAYLNGWVEKWKKSGWKKSGNEQVKNIDLWEEIEALRTIHNVQFIKVKGHADNEYNNRCDELAVNAIKNIDSVEIVREDNMYKVFGSLPTFETERLKLRLFNEQDAKDLYEYASDDEVTKNLSFETYDSIEVAKNRIKNVMENYQKIQGPIVWAIEEKETSKMIGSIDFVKWDEKHSMAEIGYVLNKKYWNKGYMTEAAKEVIKFAFEKMGVNRLVVRARDTNIGSQRVAIKCGLVYEGTLRQSSYIKGEYANIHVYSMLKEEYFK